MSGKIIRLIKGLQSLNKSEKEFSFCYSEDKVCSCSIKQLYSDSLRSFSNEELITQLDHFQCLPSQILGKKSTAVIISSSKKLCFKQLDYNSANKFIKISQDLNNHFNENPKSFLVKIYKVFQIDTLIGQIAQSDYWIIMTNLCSNYERIKNTYDIKGYTQGRMVSEKSSTMLNFGKDMNFIKSSEISLLKQMQQIKKEWFIEVCQKDIQFLQSKNLIDYSLLICFKNIYQNEKKSKVLFQNHNRFSINQSLIMECCIIDYLQQFNLKKKTQNRIKSFFTKEISSVDPLKYSKRFMQFLQNILFENQ